MRCSRFEPGRRRGCGLRTVQLATVPSYATAARCLDKLISGRLFHSSARPIPCGREQSAPGCCSAATLNASTVPALQVGQLGGVRRRPLNLVFGEPTQSFA